jgi:xanthine dehydrogenase YagT iron-sulfur-binding subunit
MKMDIKRIGPEQRDSSEGHAGSAQEIRDWMSGKLCRCGADDHIVAAIQDAARATGAVRGG